MNILEKFGHIIMMQRLARRLTQKQLAKKAELHANYICKVEGGLINPGLLHILQIAKGLDMHAETLMMHLRLPFDPYPYVKFTGITT
jgi:transcriptional regulator with XRE-family HTH domain